MSHKSILWAIALLTSILCIIQSFSADDLLSWDITNNNGIDVPIEYIPDWTEKIIPETSSWTLSEDYTNWSLAVEITGADSNLLWNIESWSIEIANSWAVNTYSWKDVITDNTTIESWYTYNSSSWEYKDQTGISDNALAVLYIPEQKSITIASGETTWTWIEPWGNTAISNNENNPIEPGKEWWDGNIAIYVSDIDYNYSQWFSPWVCINQRHCVIIQDSNGRIWWYVWIDQSEMIWSNNNTLTDSLLFLNNDKNPLQIISSYGSPDAKSILTNWSVSLENDKWWTIASKERNDGITWIYGIDPYFYADTSYLTPWSYTWSTTITLYQY